MTARSRTLIIATLIALVSLSGAVVLLIPAERTLGPAVRLVYVHVALTQTGALGFVLYALAGLAVAATGQARLQRLAQTVGWTAFIFQIGGLAMSMVAAVATWGAVAWDEPRMLAAMQITCVALIILIVAPWFPWMRIRGLLCAIPALFMAWTLARTPPVIHPANPIRTSTSREFQLAFYGLLALSCIVGALLVWYRERTRVPKVQTSGAGD